MTGWHKWFAWYPIWPSADGPMIWLRWVERRVETIVGVAHVFKVASYRLPL